MASAKNTSDIVKIVNLTFSDGGVEGVAVAGY